MFEPSASNFVIVDLDSGTVIGPNAMIVDASNVSDEEMEGILSDDAVAISYASSHGTPVRLPSTISPELAVTLASLAGSFANGREQYGYMRSAHGGRSQQAQEQYERSEEDRQRFINALTDALSKSSD